TAVGPAGMGACRFLNVLLGLAATDLVLVDLGLRLHLAAVVGIYVVGVTWFARREAARGPTGNLPAAAGVIGAALLLALPLPLHLPPGSASALFPYLLVAFALVLAAPMARAMSKPGPSRIQPAVK